MSQADYKVFVKRLMMGLSGTLLTLLLTACDSGPETSATSSPESGAPVSSSQDYFDTPEQAADALATAARDDGNDALLAIMGKEFEGLLTTDDKASEKVQRSLFSEAYQESHTLEKSADGTITLVVGKNEWPYPIPLVKEQAGWRFDTRAGIEEIINRRVGANELAAINTIKAVLDAQIKYASEDRNDNGVLEYARKFRSTPGAHDGLYWQAPQGATEQEVSPLQRFVTEAGEYLSARESDDAPFRGYHFHILTSQGPNARGGSYEYIVDDSMVAGFAIVAWPNEYGKSGVMTFVMNHEGNIYEKDLGDATTSVDSAMVAFDPDDSWKVVGVHRARKTDQ